MVLISEGDFDQLVASALDAIPPELLDLIDNAVVLVEDEPPDGEPRDLLGLYDGVPVTERWGDPPLLPDRIYIFRGPLMRWCRDLDELEDEIAITVVHEIAHHFGIDDDRLHALGWD